MSRGVMIAALSSGSGKTTITCGLLQALLNRNMKINSYKCGPDYIDPMFHRNVLNIPSHNLDTFFLGEKEVRELYERHSCSFDMSVIEGVMGLFDGLGGIRQEGSAYHVASCVKTPIILVVDAHGMGKTLIPILSGVLSYDENKLIKGVILNKTTKSFYGIIAPEIEKELGLKCLGFVLKMNDIRIESRHLGLKLPHEIEGLKENIKELASLMEETVAVEEIISIARLGENLEEPSNNDKLCNGGKHYSGGEYYNGGKHYKDDMENSSQINIAVAKDEAFCFYYEENLDLLRELGVNIIEFSPLHDTSIPKDIDGIIFGGGYPELFLEQLSSNNSLKKEIKQLIDKGIPSLAECGGFMYLQEYIVDKDGQQYEMVGAIKGGSRYTEKLVRFGYVNLNVCSGKTAESFLGKNTIKAHEFHYFDSDNNGDSCTATKPTTGKNYPCIIAGENKFWGYPHLYYPSCKEFAINFIKSCQKYKEV